MCTYSPSYPEAKQGGYLSPGVLEHPRQQWDIQLTYIHTYIHSWIYTCIYTFVHIYMYAHICISHTRHSYLLPDNLLTKNNKVSLLQIETLVLKCRMRLGSTGGRSLVSATDGFLSHICSPDAAMLGFLLLGPYLRSLVNGSLETIVSLIYLKTNPICRSQDWPSLFWRIPPTFLLSPLTLTYNKCI